MSASFMQSVPVFLGDDPAEIEFRTTPSGSSVVEISGVVALYLANSSPEFLRRLAELLAEAADHAEIQGRAA